MTILVDTTLAPVSASGLRRDTGEWPPSHDAGGTDGAGATVWRSFGCDEYSVYGRNHEDTNYSAFAYAWPHERRRLIGLYGTAFTIGPLRIVGFPCLTGSEDTWCEHLSASGDTMMLYAARHRKPLPSDSQRWLPGLMHQCGPSARTLWLMHECPMGLPLANPRVFNPVWTAAVERYLPCVTVSGHDHDTPMESGTWRAPLASTTCINVGQAETVLHFAVLDFEFNGAAPSLPTKITVQAFPWEEEAIVWVVPPKE